MTKFSKYIEMKEKIDLLVQIGMTKEEATKFCKSIYYEGANNTKQYYDVENWREDYETTEFEELIK